MILKIKDTEVPKILEDLKRVRLNYGVVYLINAIEKEQNDKKLTTELLLKEDLTIEELEDAISSVNEGFNRFQLLTKLTELEEKQKNE